MTQSEDSSTIRVIHILLRLLRGESLSYVDMEEAYGKSERTYQRYLTEIRTALAEDFPAKYLPVTKDENGRFKLRSNDDGQRLAMALAVSNIILASRSLVVAEKNQLLEFVASTLDTKEKAELKEYLLFPAGSYYPVRSSKPLLDRILQMARHISAHRRITFTYRVEGANKTELATHHGEPLSIYFDDMYFFVAIESDEHHGLWMYRLDLIDRIISYRQIHGNDQHRNFSLQRVRSESYLFAVGETRTIQFRYWNSPQMVLDRFPNSRIIKRDEHDGSTVIQASVRFIGAKMWLLGQGPALELLSPADLVADMKTTITAMLNRYQK